ncbi:response regulator [Sediminibacterium soli]|uniref:response regulator n=1 Tax=Sediminibacterium soli TaxID=2698829 RepID=UPI00137AEF08|nr:response regulator [Sediminibacterium soli]NCI46596.1 response regulator [Sediminibacterium soli]
MLYKSLVINDDPLSMMITRKLIDIATFSKETVSAVNGEDALTYFDSFVSGNSSSPVPEFIFLDLSMPVMDGWGFLEVFSSKYASLFPHVKVAITSAFLDNNDLLRLEKYAMVIGYFPPPICLEKLADIKEKLAGFFSHKRLEAVA